MAGLHEIVNLPIENVQPHGHDELLLTDSIQIVAERDARTRNRYVPRPENSLANHETVLLKTKQIVADAQRVQTGNRRHFLRVSVRNDGRERRKALVWNAMLATNFERAKKVAKRLVALLAPERRSEKRERVGDERGVHLVVEIVIVAPELDDGLVSHGGGVENGRTAVPIRSRTRAVFQENPYGVDATADERARVQARAARFHCRRRHVNAGVYEIAYEIDVSFGARRQKGRSTERVARFRGNADRFDEIANDFDVTEFAGDVERRFAEFVAIGRTRAPIDEIAKNVDLVRRGGDPGGSRARRFASFDSHATDAVDGHRALFDEVFDDLLSAVTRRLDEKARIVVTTRRARQLDGDVGEEVVEVDFVAVDRRVVKQIVVESSFG